MRTNRDRASKSGLLIAVTNVVVIAPSLLSGQAVPAGAAVPGVYAADKCQAAPFPTELPPLDGVLDTAALVESLRSAGVNQRLVVALRLGALETRPRVRALEKKVSDELAEHAVSAIEASLRDASRAGHWAFRLRIEAERDITLTLERARICAAGPGSSPPEIRREVAIMRADEVQRLMREADVARSRLRTMVHRVLVRHDGRVLAVELERSSGDTDMDIRFTRTWSQRRFTPTTLDDVPVSAWIEIRGDYWAVRR